MFVAKLTVEIRGNDYDAVQKKMKAFKTLGTRHDVPVVVESFGGDNSLPSETGTGNQQS